MVYPTLNGTQAGTDLMYFFVYANSVTHNLFGLIITIAFFLVVFLGSIFAQMRFTTRVRPEFSLLASSFATLGWATIIEMRTGILSPVYFFVIIGILILSFIWVALSE